MLLRWPCIPFTPPCSWLELPPICLPWKIRSWVVCVGVGEGGGWVGVWIRPRTSPHYFHLGRQFPKYSYEYYVRNHAPLIGLEETKEISLCQQSHYNKIMYKAISTHKLISLWLNDGVCLKLNHSFVLKRTWKPWSLTIRSHNCTLVQLPKYHTLTCSGNILSGVVKCSKVHIPTR